MMIRGAATTVMPWWPELVSFERHVLVDLVADVEGEADAGLGAGVAPRLVLVVGAHVYAVVAGDGPFEPASPSRIAFARELR